MAVPKPLSLFTAASAGVGLASFLFDAFAVSLAIGALPFGLS
jgi:hypothetical protein